MEGYASVNDLNEVIAADKKHVWHHLIQQKIARIVCGDPWERDHWVDIMGYAALVLRELDKAQTEGGSDDRAGQQSTN
jgi:hypothetical protein